MSEVKVENTNTNTSRNIKNNKIDISPILKDVEQCIKKGLDNKLQCLYHEFETYENTHNEVLNLTVVKKLVNHNNMLTRIVTNSVCKKEVKCEEPCHNSMVDNASIISEVNILKQEIIRLKEQGIKTELAFAQVLKIDGDPYEELILLGQEMRLW